MIRHVLYADRYSVPSHLPAGGQMADQDGFEGSVGKRGAGLVLQSPDASTQSQAKDDRRRRFDPVSVSEGTPTDDPQPLAEIVFARVDRASAGRSVSEFDEVSLDRFTVGAHAALENGSAGVDAAGDRHCAFTETRHGDGLDTDESDPEHGQNRADGKDGPPTHASDSPQPAARPRAHRHSHSCVPGPSGVGRPRFGESLSGTLSPIAPYCSRRVPLACSFTPRRPQETAPEGSEGDRPCRTP